MNTSVKFYLLMLQLMQSNILLQSFWIHPNTYSIACDSVLANRGARKDWNCTSTQSDIHDDIFVPKSLRAQQDGQISISQFVSIPSDFIGGSNTENLS